MSRICPLCKHDDIEIRTDGTVGEFPNITLRCKCKRCYHGWTVRLGQNLSDIEELFRMRL